MNARQKTPVAPLDFRFNVGRAALGCPSKRNSPIVRAQCIRSKLAAQNCSASFDAKQSLLNIGRGQPEQFADFRCGGRPEMRNPSLHGSKQGVVKTRAICLCGGGALPPWDGTRA